MHISTTVQIEGILRNQRTKQAGKKGTAKVVKQGRLPIPADIVNI